MITVKYNFDSEDKNPEPYRVREKKIREIIAEKLIFSGADKLDVVVYISSQGAFVDFIGPEELTEEAKKSWDHSWEKTSN